MIYKIKMNGLNVYGSTVDTTLLSPSLDIELNAAGSLEFTMPYTHMNYNDPRIMTTDVEVYEEDELIWYGRVCETDISINRDKRVYCEGALAFFNDSIQRPAEFEAVTVSSFFRTVIQNHNSQVPLNRQFKVGTVDIRNISVYRKLSYEKTIDVLNRMCLEAEGGYFIFRKEGTENVIDWLSGVPYEGSQPIQLGLNISDLSIKTDGSKLRTAILPLGKEVDGERVTIASVNSGYDYIKTDDADEYGNIIEVVEFSDIDTPADLLTEARRWMHEEFEDPVTIECNAAELHYIDNTYTPFAVGQTVRATSNVHLLDKTLPITKMHIDLDSPVKKISVGTPEKRRLTEIYKQK